MSSTEAEEEGAGMIPPLKLCALSKKCGTFYKKLTDCVKRSMWHIVCFVLIVNSLWDYGGCGSFLRATIVSFSAYMADGSAKV
jgi:hypothetical protein